MRFEIKNRWTGNVQYTAEIDCDENALRSVKVGLAVKWGLANDAVLRDADLRDADLSGAVLSGADLRDAVLSGAVLSGQTTIKKLPVSDPRPYSWIARAEGGTWIVYAGCRRFTVPEARDHWLSQAYDGPEDVKSTVALALDWIEAQAVPTPDQIAA